MTKITDQRSIVAIDPTPRGLAFAFFESGELLDWGTRRKDGGELAVLDRLLAAFKADVLVLEGPDVAGAERRPRVKALLRRLAKQARAQGVTVVSVSRKAVREEYGRQGVTRKHGVAAAIAALFPEVEPLVPRVRKVYRSEEARAEIFDAISLVLHAFPLESDQVIIRGSQRAP
jgi:hypothetical protein